MDENAPPARVLNAFQIQERPIPLLGGQGKTFRAGGYVLKQSDSSEEVAWSAQTLSQLRKDQFRVATYKPAISGAWSIDGWFAQQYLEGDHATDRWPTVLGACAAFHKALVEIKRPAFMAERTDPWAVADRMAWGEVPLVYGSRLTEFIAPLAELLRPVNLASQVIHGDFSNNVLFEEGQRPAIIDFTPYWRPVSFARAIVVVDALTWHGADETLLEVVVDDPEIYQMLLRAEIRRLMEIEEQHRQYSRDGFAQLDAHRPMVELLRRRS